MTRRVAEVSVAGETTRTSNGQTFMSSRDEFRDRMARQAGLLALGESAAGSAHELANLLTGILGFTQLLQRLDLDPDVRQRIDLLTELARSAGDVVGDMLDFVRGLEIEPTAVNLNGLLGRTLDLKSYSLRVAGVELETEFSDDVAEVMGVRSQLQLVFLNLINNAQESMIEARGRGRLKVSTSRGDEDVLVSVVDDGCGIVPENLDRVFEPFFTTKAGGTGLGLSLCRDIILRHGGRIWAESQFGEGVGFHVVLPAWHRDENPKTRATETSATRPQGPGTYWS